MKISANDIRVGMIIEYNGTLWNILKAQHIKPGKGGAFQQLEMKAVKQSTKSNVRLRAEEVVEKVDLDEEDYQYLYKDGDSYVFMNGTTYEQLTLPPEVVGDHAQFLKENVTFRIRSHNGEIIDVAPPQTMEFEVIEADPVVKGQTASSSYKPAVLENNIKIMVPPHIEAGSIIVINTEDVTYLSKAK